MSVKGRHKSVESIRGRSSDSLHIQSVARVKKSRSKVQMIEIADAFNQFTNQKPATGGICECNLRIQHATLSTINCSKLCELM